MFHRSSSNPPRVPWNKGKLIGQKRPLSMQEIWTVRMRLQTIGNLRDLALFNLAIDSKFRACDLLSLRISDVASGKEVQSRAIIRQRKTKRPVRFEITARTRKSIEDWIEVADLTEDAFLFLSRPGNRVQSMPRKYSFLHARTKTTRQGIARGLFLHTLRTVRWADGVLVSLLTRDGTAPPSASN